jgi:hypothetical protein
MPGQPLARFAFRSKDALIETLQIGNLASDLQRALRSVKHSSPDDRTLTRICYHSLLMKQSMAMGMLKALSKYANQNHLVAPPELFHPGKALVEFNCEVVGLSGLLARATAPSLSAEVNPLEDIAEIVGTMPETILQMARGKYVLVPEEFARSVAIAAARVLELSEPLTVRALPVNETDIKPLGGTELEQGKPPYACDQTIEIRADVLKWLGGRKQSAD